MDGFRFDLDDVNGEVMLLRWGMDSTGQELDVSKHKLKEEHAGGKTLPSSQRWVVRAMRALELRYQAAAREESVQRFNLEVSAPPVTP